jgi:nicotinamide mononucleotide transporter
VSVAAVLDAIATVWAGTTPAEAAGAVLGIIYVVLVIGQYRACWIAALLSTALYLWVFADARLYMQAALQGYYVLVAIYGWWAWRGRPAGETLTVSRASWRSQLAGLAAVAVVSIATAAWLARETHSTQAYLDSTTTWASVYATWLVARKKIDNWPWWLVIDALIAVLCWNQQLYATMILYILYLGLVVIGWRSWYSDMKAAVPTATTGRGT